VDLTALSARFQADIAGWRGTASPSDSSVTPDPNGSVDSSVTHISGLSDSTVASVEAVSDTLEDCAHDE
jgi:hypothetical protein